jgi:anti-anti-sigma factor
MKFSGLVGVGDLIQKLPFDAVETVNANFTEYFANRKAARRAGKLARVGSSDGHFLHAIGCAYTEFPGAGAEGLRTAVQEATTVAGGACYGAVTLARFCVDRLRNGQWIIPRRHRVRRESQAGELEIRIHEDSSLDAAVLAPVGRIDAASMPELKQTLTLLTNARVSVILDLSGVHFLGSPGVTALVAGLKGARQAGVGFCLAKLSTPCIQTLSAARLLSVFPRARDVGQARKQLGADAAAAAAAL